MRHDAVDSRLDPCMLQATHHPALHRIALLTAAATFPLIFMGGVVTSKQAGLSVPDWPNSYGYNMFLFPPSQWVGGIFYEHTHRLMGTVVGFLSIALVAAAWGPAAHRAVRWWSGVAALAFAGFSCLLGLMLVVFYGAQVPHIEAIAYRTSLSLVTTISVALICVVVHLCRRQEARPWVRWLCLSVLIAVIIQGTLGGERVTKDWLLLAIIHGCFAQAVFCLMGFTALATSRLWLKLAGHAPSASPGAKSLARWATAATALVYLQLMVGATMRHYDAGLAIPDLPLSYGRVLPPTDQAGLDAANLSRADAGEPELRLVTLAQIWLQFAHRIGAVLVTAVLTVVIAKSLRRRQDFIAVRNPALLLVVLLLTQLTLGVLTVLWRKPADIASLHVAFGALVLMTTFLLAVRVTRAHRSGLFEPKLGDAITHRSSEVVNHNVSRQSSAANGRKLVIDD